MTITSSQEAPGRRVLRSILAVVALLVLMIEFGTHQSALVHASTSSGTFIKFALPAGSIEPYDITASSNGALWFTVQGTNQIGKITPFGHITEFTIPSTNSIPTGITAASNGTLWFAENATNKIGHFVP